MSERRTVDRYKLRHWMNARKLTPQMVADSLRVETSVIDQMLDGRTSDCDERIVRRLAELPASAPRIRARHRGGMRRRPGWRHSRVP